MKRTLTRIGSAFRAALRSILPPPPWQVPVILLLGVLVGLGLLAFHVSRASSYLSDDPQTCVNCHVMAPQYATWAKSRHREVATCNDCHVPHDNPFRHYFFKASDGMRHATLFTLRLEPQVIQIRRPGMRVVQENCVRCHVTSIHTVMLEQVSGDDLQHRQGLRCWDCHRETPHGTVRSLAAVPYEHVPLPGPVLPDWMRAWLSRAPPPVEPAQAP